MKYGSIKGLVARATRLDDVGKWVSGASGSAVSKGWIKIDFSGQSEAGTEYVQKNAAGELCINDKDADAFKGYDITIDFCNVDPELFELLAGVRVVEDYNGDVVGFAAGEDIRLTGGFALEIWTQRANVGGYIYNLLGWVGSNSLGGDFTIEQAAATFQIKGRTKANTNWGRGPYDVVVVDGIGTAGKLDAPGLEDTEHILQRVTTVAPPTAPTDGGYTAQLVAWS